MTVSVFIDGAVGTTGIDIRERLSGRSDLTIVTLDEARRKDAAARAEALNDSDFAILCLPDEAAKEAAALVRDGGARIIDASSAHRVATGWTYGFPELDAGQADRAIPTRLQPRLLPHRVPRARRPAYPRRPCARRLAADL
jgi:N-acetyl-gamma-glutamyl-phosphate reductase